MCDFFNTSRVLEPILRELLCFEVDSVSQIDSPFQSPCDLKLLHHLCPQFLPLVLFGVPPLTSLWSRIANPVRGLYKKGKNAIGGVRKSVTDEAKKAAEKASEQKVSQIVF